jgi:hypothetical protein
VVALKKRSNEKVKVQHGKVACQIKNCASLRMMTKFEWPWNPFKDQLNIYFTQFYIGPDSSHVDQKVCKKLNMVLNPSICKGQLIIGHGIMYMFKMFFKIQNEAPKR